MPHTTQEAQPSKMQVASVISFYMVAALVMVFVNKAVLNSSPNLPLLMLVIQFLVAVLCLHLSAYFTPKIEIPRRLLSLDKFKQLLPILLTNVIGLTFNTLCLRGVDASFFQIARGLVLPLTIMVSAVDRRAYPAVPVLIAGSVVTVGFFVGIVPKPAAPGDIAKSTSAPFMSLVWGALSSLMTAIHAVLIKRSLPYVDNSAIQLAYWTNASAAIFLLPFVLIDGEVSSIWTSLGYGQFVDPMGDASAPDVAMTWDWQTFVIGSLVTGVVGFLLCVAGLLSIKITSPVTHMFSSACRSVLQTLLGVWIFHDIMNANRLTSICTILGGSMYYTWIKSKEADQKQQQSAMDKERGREDEEMEEGLLMQQLHELGVLDDENEHEHETGSDSMTLFEAADGEEDGDVKKGSGDEESGEGGN